MLLDTIYVQDARGILYGPDIQLAQLERHPIGGLIVESMSQLEEIGLNLYNKVVYYMKVPRRNSYDTIRINVM